MCDSNIFKTHTNSFLQFKYTSQEKEKIYAHFVLFYVCFIKFQPITLTSAKKYSILKRKKMKFYMLKYFFLQIVFIAVFNSFLGQKESFWLLSLLMQKISMLIENVQQKYDKKEYFP